MVVGIVDERDVDPVQAEALQARLDTAPDAVGAEVESPDVAGWHGEALGVAARGSRGAGRLKQAADLRGDHVLGAPTVPERVTQAPFRQPEAVVRRGVEGPDSAVPGRVDGGAGVAVGDLGKQVPNGRAAEGQFGNAYRRFPQERASGAEDA